jgi:acetyl esterase/lipase
MRLEGNTSLPAPTILPYGINITVPSRGAHSIPCRLFYPSHLVPDPDDPSSAEPYPASKPKTAGVILHIHGGGWVLGDQESTDSLLAFYANVSRCAVLSVGYRRAPEEPYPAAIEDCEDVGEWCVRGSEREFGGPLRFIGGEVSRVSRFFSGVDALHDRIGWEWRKRKWKRARGDGRGGYDDAQVKGFY